MTPPSGEPGPVSGEPAPWLRLHPLTPWLRGWAIIVALGAFVVNQAQNSLDELMEVGRLAGIAGIAAVIFGVLVLATAYNLVWWRMARFRIGSEVIELRAGIVMRQHRSFRLDRLEAVDIVHPIVARLFGLAELRFEAAGGTDSNLSLKYVTGRQADALRAQVLARRPGSPTTGPGTAGPPGVAAAAELGPRPAPEARAHLFRVPPRWTIESYLRSLHPWVMLAISLATMGVIIGTGQWGGVIASLPFIWGFFQAFWKYIVTEMGFTGFVHPDGIQLRHGLLTQVNQSIPASRLQAIRLQQRWFWRGPGWWRITMNVAGYGLEAQDRTLLVPVADPAMAVLAVSPVMPGATAPEIWAVVERAMSGLGPEPGFVTSPRRARVFDPLVWRRQGYATTPYALVLRGGRLTRTVTIVPHDRIQGISVTSGWWDRRRGLASITLHSTLGPVVATIRHLDGAAVAELFEAEVPLIARAPVSAGGRVSGV